MRKGLIVSVSGPSGVGKGTVIKEIRKINSDFVSSCSVTTRAPREGEQDGVDYFFRTREVFEQMIKDGEIIEYDSFVGNLYGTPSGPLIKETSEGKDVLLDLTIPGSMALKSRFDNAITIFLMPPSLEELENRIRGRGTETDDVIRKRLNSAEEEMSKAGDFDYVVYNNDPNEAALEILKIIYSHID